MKNRLLRSEAVSSALGRALAGYIKLVFRTGRMRSDPDDAHAKLMANHPCIITVWHGQGFMALPARPDAMKVKVLVTAHADGQFAGRALSRLGAELIQGAGAGRKRKRDKGGAQALRGMLRALADGYSVIITADMPGAPARRAGLGVVTLSRLSGRPIMPVALTTRRRIALNTWSRFVVNLPFSRIGFVVGDPITAPRAGDDETMEHVRTQVEAALNDAARRAEALSGRPPARDAEPAKASGKARPGLMLKAYTAATRAMEPASGFILRARERRGKEIEARLSERLGRPSAPRPEGVLWWFHAASVGETNAILPLLHALKASSPALNILLTTVTVTSARIAEARLPAGAIHQFLPLDSPAYVKRFLDAWRPDLALFTESEIWPNLILEADARGVPLLLLNARMSDRSFARWRRLQGVSRPLFSRFQLILAQTNRLARRLEKLGAPRTAATGNLKFDAPPPPVARAELARIQATIGPRPVFLAASTHPGEDEIVLEAHRRALARMPKLLTIIAPRHPDRGGDIEAAAKTLGLATRRRGLAQEPDAAASVFIADTIGELGLFYSLASVAFVGGSLVKHGGQNPVEAVKLGAAVLTGPHVFNFKDAYKTLERCGGCRVVHGVDEMARAMLDLYGDPALASAMRDRAERGVAALGGALQRTLDALRPYLPPSAPEQLPAPISYAS
ncbi:MAG: glycosyltransferase N-terminal domain-containing protein [Hyphomicrobiales bacterium]|nr:glycosyltransferase N-terminal domain-containing protein [Hyphomicrobiales bacterium]